MVETITPVVHGGRRGRWGSVLALHVLGAGVAAATFGALLGGAGSLLGAPWGAAGLAVVIAAAALYLARELLGVPVPVPQLKRQVPEWWRTFFGPSASSLLYGLGLGVGFLTYLLHGTLVVVTVAAVASGRPLVGALVTVPFGISRGATAAVARRATGPEASAALVGRLAARSSWRGWRIAHVVVLAAVLVAAAAALGSAPRSRADLGAVAAAGLSMTFGASAIAKLVRWRRWRRALAAYDVPAERAVAAAVPAVEALVAVLPFIGFARAAGLLAAALVTVFSIAILVARLRRGPRLECGCFGGVRARDYRVLLARNALLALVAVAAWRWAPPAGAMPFRAPRGDEIVAALLVAFGSAGIVALGVAGGRYLRTPPRVEP
jgi:hypothetical protein